MLFVRGVLRSESIYIFLRPAHTESCVSFSISSSSFKPHIFEKTLEERGLNKPGAHTAGAASVHRNPYPSKTWFTQPSC